MPYIELSDLDGEIPPDFLTQALDDDHDQVIDAWEKVQTSACEEVDSLLEGRFRVPLQLNPLPKIIKRAAVAFACELCYRRRSVPDQDNPWASRANALRKTLQMITAGDLQLSVEPTPPEPFEAGTIHSWESKLGAPGRPLG